MFFSVFAVALLAEGVDRNWWTAKPICGFLTVALLAEGVDRNVCCFFGSFPGGVALLAEGVDRNDYWKKEGKSVKVALLAEGVDRNICFSSGSRWHSASPSSRRAWIEMGKKSES